MGHSATRLGTATIQRRGSLSHAHRLKMTAPVKLRYSAAMSKIFVLDVLERKGDLLYHRLRVNGEPYKLRFDWQYLNHTPFLHHWPSHEGGSTVFIPLNEHEDESLLQEIRNTEVFVAYNAILPHPCRRRSFSPLLVNDGKWELVGWHPELLPHRQGWFRFDVDLSYVATGPKKESSHTIRFEPVVDIQFLPA